MTATRDDMLASLKSHVVPQLRSMGFKGSMPHFYRDRNGGIDLLAFQFSQSGGRFVVEASFVGTDRDNLCVGFKDVVPSKMRVAATRKRYRIGRESMKRDPWFIYDQAMPQYGETMLPPDDLAKAVLVLIAAEGVSWWDSHR